MSKTKETKAMGETVKIDPMAEWKAKVEKDLNSLAALVYNPEKLEINKKEAE